MTKHALGLPSGSIRGVIAIIVVLSTCGLAIWMKQLQVLGSICTSVITFYFLKGVIEKAMGKTSIQEAVSTSPVEEKKPDAT